MSPSLIRPAVCLWCCLSVVCFSEGFLMWGTRLLERRDLFADCCSLNACWHNISSLVINCYWIFCSLESLLGIDYFDYDVDTLIIFMETFTLICNILHYKYASTSTKLNCFHCYFFISKLKTDVDTGRVN